MTAFSDRMREATIVLRDEYAVAVESAIAEISNAHQRPQELLCFVRASFQSATQPEDVALVIETFRKRGITGSAQLRQLWATLAGLVLISRFERGPGKRTENRLLPDSVASMSVVVLAAQGCDPVHRDVTAYAIRWRDEVAEALRARGGVSPAPGLPTALEPLAPTPPVATATEEAAETAPPSSPTESQQIEALVSYAREVAEWNSRSSPAARLVALEEEQDLNWWLSSGANAPHANSNVSDVVVRACDELLAITRVFPGPPGAAELLARRLGKLSEKPIKPEELAGKARRSLPPAIDGLCSLAAGRVPLTYAEHPTIAREAAEQLFSELVLAQIAGGLNA